MEAPGPAALMPAQVTQLCHPLILCIWLFTVCADEESEPAAKRNSATARMGKFLIVFFTITRLLLQGMFLFPSRSISRPCCRLPTHLLWNNPFSPLHEKSQNRGL